MKKQGSKGMIELATEGTVIEYKPFETFEEFQKCFDEAVAYQDEINAQRQKEYNEASDQEEKEKAEILALKHIHAKVDALKGLYPMTYENLLECIELVSNALMDIDVNGNMTSSKNRMTMWAWYLKDNATNEQLYEYYLTEVKPYIHDK